MPHKTKQQEDSRLPNAPLVEVVFELRWNLYGDASTPPPFRKDPGYDVLADGFLYTASKHGFSEVKKINPNNPLVAHSVDFRLFGNKEQKHPLWQIGPGIFASNESTEYEWNKFKKMTSEGVKLLFENYPNLKSFEFQPISLELRYIDSFGSLDQANQHLLDFLNENTSLNVKLPTFLTNDPMSNESASNLVFTFPIRKKKGTSFSIQLADASISNKKAIYLHSKVFTDLSSTRVVKDKTKRLKYINEWLEDAHSITSPFFKDFVNDSLMENYRSEKK